MNFSLRQLEYAVAVGRHLNFREAAAACHVSQPSLSTQIQQLEGAVGGQIFERSARQVVVTEFGARFLGGAERVLTEALALSDLARADRAPLSGELRVGIIPTIAPYIVPKLVTHVRQRYPDCHLRCIESRTERLVELLKANDLDVLLLALEADLAGLESAALFRDPFLACLPDDHELASGPSVALGDLPIGDLLLLEEGHCLADQVRVLCGPLARGAPLDVRATSLTTLRELVRLGEGVTLLPKMAEMDSESSAGLALLPIEPAAFRTIGLAWRAQSPRRPEFELFGELVEELAARS